jgi:hypothetical protein
MKIFLELTRMMVSECEHCKEPHTYPKPYRALCSECGTFGGSFPDVVYPAPLQTPRIDPDGWSRERIKKWLRDTDETLCGDYGGDVDEDDIIELLLKFEKYLAECEVKRQRL